MARASHRLDLVVVAGDPADRPLSVESTLGALRDVGVIVGAGEPGPRAEALVAGGFVRVRVDDPGRTVLYANGQGGFVVRCPRGTVVTHAWTSAYAAWKTGGPMEVRCPACGEVHPFGGLDYAPPATYGRFAVVIADAADGELAPAGASLFRGLFGTFSVIGRRVG